MKTKIRFNASVQNSSRLRELQREYETKSKPARVSLESLANLAIEKGIDYARSKLNLAAE